MRRITKKLLVLSFGLIFTFLYCEYLIYYVVVAQCAWPLVQNTTDSNAVLKAFILADIHMLGPFRGHWLDMWRREWQMHRAYQTILTLHQPDIVFILGDLFDEGEWTSMKQFQEYVDRFYKLFYVPDDIKLHVIAGNHDIGFHNNIRRGSAERFEKLLEAPSVRHIVIKGIHFVLINSMAMHGDSCRLCTDATDRLLKISETLECPLNQSHCRPILFQHFPLYRLSDEVCTEPDAPPYPEKRKKFRSKIDALSKASTDFLALTLKPRVAFGGHTHHGCLLLHKYEGFHFEEHSVPSFSWRNRPDPKFLLVSLTPQGYSVNKCGLPREITIAMTAVVLTLIILYLTFTLRLLGSKYYSF